jgi:hypothetical protein
MYASWMGDDRVLNPYIGEMVTGFYMTGIFGYGVSLTIMGILVLLYSRTTRTHVVDGPGCVITFMTRNPSFHYAKIESVMFQIFSMCL